MPLSMRYIRGLEEALGSSRNVQNHHCVGTFMKDVKKGPSWESRYSLAGKRGMGCKGRNKDYCYGVHSCI